MKVNRINFMGERPTATKVKSSTENQNKPEKIKERTTTTKSAITGVALVAAAAYGIISAIKNKKLKTVAEEARSVAEKANEILKNVRNY